MSSAIFYRITKVAILSLTLAILTGCGYDGQFGVKAIAKEPTQRSAWIAYWDLAAGQKDLDMLKGKLDKVSYFGAYFDKDDQLFVPQELVNQKQALKGKEKYQTYLTFVNDKQNADGSVLLKDIEILKKLLATDASMEQHIDEIIALTLQGGYNGIEIDYERIWKDDKVGQAFVKFTNKLYVKALKKKLKLRIVLEPSTPFSSAGFLKGPEYVVMLYNLYGLHSGPGPKANKVFIEKKLAKIKALPGDKVVAFSTGGCVWGEDGKKSFITEADARTLASIYNAETTRDKDSQCVVFAYENEGVSYRVWYADVDTLNYWINIAKEQGINKVSLWRLGGNIGFKKII